MNQSRSFAVDVLGVGFTISVGSGVDAAAVASLERAWSRCAPDRAPAEAKPRKAEVLGLPFAAVITYDNSRGDTGRIELQSPTFEGLSESITSELTLAAILEQAGQLTMLHACGVAAPDGAVIALVAKSGTGKTTAATALGRKFSYVTDETVAIRDDGTVMPYPKPLSVKQAAGGSKLQIGPDELGLMGAPEHPRIGAIVLLNRIKSPVQVTSLTPVPLADAILALIPETSSQSMMTDPLQSMCRLIESVGGVWQVTYTEAQDLSDVLAPLVLGGRAVSAEGSAQWSVPRPTDAGESLPDGWLRRASVIDAVEVGEELLVLLNDQVVRLAGIAPAIWDITAAAVSEGDLVKEIGERHGLPAGYEVALDAAVAELIRRGLLRRG
jgi:hypothetical protein